ncbi:hypothetical protein OKW41_000696 [Paraburkholderia sp. UCT70]
MAEEAGRMGEQIAGRRAKTTAIRIHLTVVDDLSSVVEGLKLAGPCR